MSPWLASSFIALAGVSSQSLSSEEASATPLSPLSVVREVKLVAEGLTPQSFFGFDVAISGERIAVGSPKSKVDALDPDEVVGPGEVYVFSPTEPEVRITAPAGIAGTGQEFGLRVCLEDDLLVVQSAKALHSYRNVASVWTEESPIAVAANSMSLSEGRLAVASLTHGSVRVYEQSPAGWVQAGEIELEVEGFGADVVLSRQGMIVGADEAAYVFREDASGWKIEAVLDISGPEAAVAFFGAKVAMDGDRVAVGARQYGPTDTGAVFVYRRAASSQWTLEQRLDPRQGQPFEFFGEDLSLEGSVLCVGAGSHDIRTEFDAGIVYQYRAAGIASWSLERRLAATDFSSDSRFGVSLHLDGRFLIVGAPVKDLGSAYLYDIGSQ